MSDLPKPFQRSIVPEGEQGSAKIEKFEITEEGAKLANLRSMFSPGMGRRLVHPGTHTRLMINGRLVMSDTHAEAYEHLHAVRSAKDHTLLNGLGLGFVLHAILSKKPEVEHITVIEKNRDVIDLVAPSFKNDRVTIINADAMVWRPEKGQRFGFVWHDIWTDICSDNLEDMKTLHRSYGRRCDAQASWSREYL